MMPAALRRFAPWAIGIVLAMCWDRAVYLHLRAGGPAATTEQAAAAADQLESRTWYQALYILGTLWPWLIVAAALVFADVGGGEGGNGTARARRGIRRSVFLVLCTLLAGGATEGAKIIFRRLRPDQSNGFYQFRPVWEDFWSGSNLGLPSSHAGVAFGAAFALSWIFPRAAWVFVAAAVGCALSRMLVGAHYFSDVLVGTCMAFWIVEIIRRIDLRNNRGVAISE